MSELSETEHGDLWEAIERAFLDTTTWNRAAEDAIDAAVERIVAARVASAAAEAWDEGARQGGANEYRSLETQVRNPYRAVLAPAADAATGGETE